MLQSLSLKVCLYTFISCHLKKIIKIGFPELKKKISLTISLFLRKLIAEVLSLAVLNRSRIEHLCDIISKAQIWLFLSLPVFMFVYLHFNVPPTRITDLVRNYQMKRFISDMEQSPLSMFLLLSPWFVFSQSYS